MNRVTSVDLHPLAVPKVCDAIDQLFSTLTAFGADAIHGAIDEALQPDLGEFVVPSFLRVLAAMNHAQDGAATFDVEPVVSYFTLDGKLQQTLSRAYIKASLLVPIYQVPQRSGELASTMDPRTLASFTKSIENGKTPPGGMIFH